MVLFAAVVCNPVAGRFEGDEGHFRFVLRGCSDGELLFFYNQ